MAGANENPEASCQGRLTEVVSFLTYKVEGKQLGKTHSTSAFLTYDYTHPQVPKGLITGGACRA